MNKLCRRWDVRKWEDGRADKVGGRWYREDRQTLVCTKRTEDGWTNYTFHIVFRIFLRN